MGGNCSSCPQHLGKGRKTAKKQRGGATYAVDVSKPITTASGVPLALNQQIDPYCSWDTRGAQLGGSRSRKRTQRQQQQQRQQQRQQQQQGGACGCGAQRMVGGGGTGGHGFDLTEPSKLYGAVTVGACPAQPVATPLVSQSGGMAPIGGAGSMAATGSDPSPSLVVSYPSGYALDKPFHSVGGSANFLDYSSYDKSCMGGGAWSMKKKNKNKKRRSSRRS